MTSVDELFKKPGQTASKRKFDTPQDPNEIYKAAKLSSNGDVKGKEHAATVEEDGEEEEFAGPELPPDDEQHSGVDDEEGRFFGGGISKDTADVLDYIERREEQDQQPEWIDSAWLRRAALNFERRISKNSELRAKFEGDPQRFMSSEADLDADVKAWSILTDHPELYEEFAKLGCVGSMVSLLAHENTDIAIDAIEILSELTDEDVQAQQSQLDAFINAVFDADISGLLVQNIMRLDEDNEADRSGVYHSLSLVENLASQSTAADILLSDSTLLGWLLARIQKKEKMTTQNKQYAAEVLAIILQSSSKARVLVAGKDGVDSFLQLLSVYRRRDPEKDSEAEELSENLFDCLVCMVDEEAGKSKFLEAEGVELCLIMLREGKFSKPRALRLLDHAAGGQTGAEVCARVVEAAGLKTVFGMFMKRLDHADTEHILGIFASLLRLLPNESPGRIRTLAKFMEKSYEKIEKLLRIRHDCAVRLLPIDGQIRNERANATPEEQEQLSDEWLSRRLDSGLFSRQTVDVILAWLVAEDAGARRKIVDALAERGESLHDVRTALEEQLDGLPSGTSEAEETEADMLRTLMQYLE